METVIISSKFQVTLPQKTRVTAGFCAGDKVHVFPFRNRIEIMRARDVRSLRGFVKGINTSFERDDE